MLLRTTAANETPLNLVRRTGWRSCTNLYCMNTITTTWRGSFFSSDGYSIQARNCRLLAYSLVSTAAYGQAKQLQYWSTHSAKRHRGRREKALPGACTASLGFERLRRTQSILHQECQNIPVVVQYGSLLQTKADCIELTRPHPGDCVMVRPAASQLRFWACTGSSSFRSRSLGEEASVMH